MLTTTRVYSTFVNPTMDNNNPGDNQCPSAWIEATINQTLDDLGSERKELFLGFIRYYLNLEGGFNSPECTDEVLRDINDMLGIGSFPRGIIATRSTNTDNGKVLDIGWRVTEVPGRFPIVELNAWTGETRVIKI